MTMAERLAADGHEVTLVTPVPAGAEMDTFSKPPMMRRLRAANVRFVEYSSVTAIEPGRIQVQGATGGWLDCDAVVLAWYGVAETTLYDELRRAAPVEIHAVGDCLAPRRAIDAIWDGFRIGQAI
jgi:hypothetical protein